MLGGGKSSVTPPSYDRSIDSSSTPVSSGSPYNNSLSSFTAPSLCFLRQISSTSSDYSDSVGMGIEDGISTVGRRDDRLDNTRVGLDVLLVFAVARVA